MDVPDTTLICGKQTFKAHKMMLCASSLYFRNIYLRYQPETRSGNVILNGIDPEALAVLLNAMYFGPLPQIEDIKKLKSLLAASYELQYKGFYEYCCVQYMKKLSDTYFVDIWNTAELYKNQEMLTCIPVQLARSFHTTKDSKEFLLLNVTQVRSIIELLDYQCADILISSVLRWIKHDPTRTKYLSELFSLIEVNRASTSYLSSLVKNELLIKKSVHVLSLIMGVFSKSGMASPNVVILRRPQPDKTFHNHNCRMHKRQSRRISQSMLQNPVGRVTTISESSE